MKYQKPSIIQLGSAMSTIQGQLSKPANTIPDSPLAVTISAYEADE